MQPGYQLANGRYTLERQITRSGMAEVWIARQQVGGGMSKSVVVKMIHPDLSGQQEARQRFFDEARFMSQIHHSHVVQFYDFGEEEDDDLLYQVMEYIEGFALEQVVSRCNELGQSIPLPIVCRLIADTCEGLGYIHDLTDGNGVNMELVHRDISPQNLLISKSGSIKIIDFGIVKAKDKSSRTRTGVIVGKLQYMSPEQLSSEDLDRRSDIYSLGLVLYELLTLVPRFRGNNLLEIFYEALNEPPPPVVDLRPDCPPSIVQCLQTSLRQDKDHRFLNAYRMQEALESYLHQQGALVSDRQIAEFLSDLFQDNESLTEQTTQIHAASLLSAGLFQNDDSSEATVSAWAEDILGGHGFDHEGTMEASPGFSNAAHFQEDMAFATRPVSVPPRQNDGHTLGGFQPPEQVDFGIDSHTLAPTSANPMPYATRETLAPRRGIDQVNEDPTMLSAAIPSLSSEPLPLTPPPPSAGGFYAPPPPPPSPSPSHDSGVSVMISPALLEEAGVHFHNQDVAPAQTTSPIPTKTKSTSGQRAETSTNQGFLSVSHGNWIIIILFTVFIGVFVALLAHFL